MGAAPSAVLPRHPKYIARALVIHATRRNEQKIRQTVDVFERRSGDALPRLVSERNHDPLGTPAACAGKMQIGCTRAAARQDERLERGKLGVEAVDLAFKPCHL